MTKSGLQKKVMPRLKPVLVDTNLSALSKPAVRRLARRGGVKRISGAVYDLPPVIAKKFLTEVIKDSMTYAKHANRKTISAMDVVRSLKRKG